MSPCVIEIECWCFACRRHEVADAMSSSSGAESSESSGSEVDFTNLDDADARAPAALSPAAPPAPVPAQPAPLAVVDDARRSFQKSERCACMDVRATYACMSANVCVRMF